MWIHLVRNSNYYWVLLFLVTTSQLENAVDYYWRQVNAVFIILAGKITDFAFVILTSQVVLKHDIALFVESFLWILVKCLEFMNAFCLEEIKIEFSLAFVCITFMLIFPDQTILVRRFLCLKSHLRQMLLFRLKD